MRVRKAVVTAAGRGGRVYPVVDTVQQLMLPLVDRDGIAKPILQIIADEALAAGAEEVAVVCAPGDEPRYRSQMSAYRDTLVTAYTDEEWARAQAARLSDLLGRLHFPVQEEPLGYGHAVLCAREFTGGERFLLLLGDHVYVSHIAARCAEQLVTLAVREGCPVSAVQATREHLVGRYGTLSGSRVAGQPGLYQVEKIREKPPLSKAELELMTPGLRAGHYLCFFGMHVLDSALFEILAEHGGAARREGRSLQLTPALDELCRREKYLALEVAGRRWDIGERFGALQAQIALALGGTEREAVLTTLLETVADAGTARGGNSR